MAIELHIPISHLDKSRFFCAPALSLSLPSISGKRDRGGKRSISKRSLEGRPKGKEEDNMKRRQKGKKKKRQLRWKRRDTQGDRELKCSQCHSLSCLSKLTYEV